jgi:hypothetical protein
MVWMDLQGKFWINHCVMFSVTSSARICGQSLDPVLAILEAQGIGPIFKWVDDCDFMVEPVSPAALPGRDPSLPLHTYHFLVPSVTVSPSSSLLLGASALPIQIPSVKDVIPPLGTQLVTWSYPYALDDVCKATEPLQVPWAHSKWIQFDFCTVYLGFLWDYWNRRVSLPDGKHLKYYKQVMDFIGFAHSKSLQVALAVTQKLHGSLVHICSVH